MNPVQEILSVFVISNALIFAFYKIFQVKWPELYFSVNDQASYLVSVSPLRYVLFRLLPPFIISSILLGSLINKIDERSFMLLGIGIFLFHSLMTNGRSLRGILINSGKTKVYFNKYFQIIFHLFTIVILLVLGVVSAWVAFKGFLLIITPSIDGLVDNIWSSIITSFFSVLLYDAYSRKTYHDISSVLHKSHIQIPDKIIDLIHEKSIQYNANERLVLAICIVENLQRPAWVRKIENGKSIFGKKGSYGIMQVSSEKYLSDEESVEFAVSKYFSNSKFEYIDYDTAKKWISGFNSGETYFDLVYSAYNYLPSNYDEPLPG